MLLIRVHQFKHRTILKICGLFDETPNLIICYLGKNVMVICT